MFDFQHVVIVLTSFLAYAIPDIPSSVKQHLHHQRNQLKEFRVKALNEEFMEQQRRIRRDPKTAFANQTLFRDARSSV